ncbi:ABC transporter permease [Candidatus Saccharibacteria bacterium]|nr:ABC transporter permease [Candidatus Saccharibacteria bacterium]
MFNLSTVISFEIVRALKKPSFWAMAILMPLMLVALIGISGWSGYSSNQIFEASGSTEGLQVALIDQSGLIAGSPLGEEIAQDIEMRDDKETSIDQVKNGQLNVLYVVPAEISAKNAIEIYTNTENNSLFDSYTNNIRSILTTAAMAGLSENQINILSGQINVTTHNFIEGEEANILGKMIVPIIGLILFYVLICLFGNRLMMSTLEEKENRISEMILTSISTKTLIVGKIISLIALGFLQVLILVLPMAILYYFAGNASVGQINIGDVLPHIVFDPLVIIYTLLLLIASYVLFTGLCVTVGVLMPTAKEASGFMGVLMMLVIAPFLFITMFMAPAPSTVVKFLSFFPFSAPVALSMRNAFGTLSASEAIIGLVIIIVSAIAIIALAIRLFRKGAMSYDSALINLKRLFAKK